MLKILLLFIAVTIISCSSPFLSEKVYEDDDFEIVKRTYKVDDVGNLPIEMEPDAITKCFEELQSFGLSYELKYFTNDITIHGALREESESNLIKLGELLKVPLTNLKKNESLIYKVDHFYIGEVFAQKVENSQNPGQTKLVIIQYWSFRFHSGSYVGVSYIYGVFNRKGDMLRSDVQAGNTALIKEK